MMSSNDKDRYSYYLYLRALLTQNFSVNDFQTEQGGGSADRQDQHMRYGIHMESIRSLLTNTAGTIRSLELVSFPL